jgi:AraC family transcriptional regulator
MHRLSPTVEWIEARLGERITVRAAARTAGLSPHHFCRLFRAVTGESVMGYVRARCLTVAAHRLVDCPNDRLIDIAFDAGFDSQEAFTRAFKRQFAITPGAFRARPLADPARFRPPLTDAALTHWKETHAMTPTFTDLPETHAVGLRISVRPDTKGDIPKAWKTLHARMDDIQNARPGHALGILLHKAGGPGRGFDYLCALEVESIPDAPPAGMEAITLAPCRYAVFTHVIRDPNLGKDLPRSFDYIFGTWLPDSGYRLADAPDFEYYDQSRFDAAALSGEIDLYIPVVPREAD